jgi:hypothetical protein
MPSNAPQPRLRPVPPGWCDDALSDFLSKAQANQHGTFANDKRWYGRLAAIDALFLSVAQNIINPKELVPTALFYRAHAAYRAACGLAMSGQANETFALTRSCLEYAAYALLMTSHPGHDIIWLDRNQSEAHKSNMLRAFRMEKVRGSIAHRDRGLLKVFDQLYERSIDFGGHPNQRGVVSSVEIELGPERSQFLQTYLHGNGMHRNHALKSTAQCGICALRIFQFMMKEKFELLGVRAGIEVAQQGL